MKALTIKSMSEEQLDNWADKLLQKNGYRVLSKEDRNLIAQLISNELQAKICAIKDIPSPIFVEDGDLFKSKVEFVERSKAWSTFRDTKLLWFVNRMLHIFGYSIVLDMNDNKEVIGAYPKRVAYRGFNEEVDELGFKGLTKYMKDNVNELEHEVNFESIF